MSWSVEPLQAALAAADAASTTALEYFSIHGLAPRHKPDGSALTVADLAVEEAVRSVLDAMTPGVPIVAEESASEARPTDCWVVDPIDGTENFSRGVPVWATLISMLSGGVPSHAVIVAPALGRQWTATAGGGSYADGQRLQVSTRATRRHATLACGGLHEPPSAAAREAMTQTATTFRCAWGWGSNTAPTRVMALMAVAKSGYSPRPTAQAITAPSPEAS